MDKDNLLKNIWKTRKSRINTAERYISNSEFISNINIYYSLTITVLSLYLIKYPEDNISLIAVALSICLTVSIVFIGTKRYDERAKDLKNNYISLNDLLIRASNENMEISQINKEYKELLDSCENHSEYDYLTTLFNATDEKLTSWQWTKFIFMWVSRKLIRIVIVSFPLIMLIPFYNTIFSNLFSVK